MLKPLASVHMITYNQALHIERAIEGVLAQQTDFQYQLIIGEDCSTDGTREIVLKYAAAHPSIIRVVTSPQRVGMHENSRRTLDACTGKYVAWCEGDDYWHHPEKLQLQVAYLEAHQDCGLVFSDYDYCDNVTGLQIKGYIKARDLVPPDTISLSDILFGRVDIRTCTACAPIALVRDLHAADPFLYSEEFRMRDLPLWVDLLMHSRLFYLPESTATHNVLLESVSHSQCDVQRQRFSVSAREMKVYLARKYDAATSEASTLEASRADGKLFLAFLELDHVAARKALSDIDRPTVRQRLLFYGAQNRSLNNLLRLGLRTKQILSNRQPEKRMFEPKAPGH